MNSTVNVQMNDIKSLPIPVPTTQQLSTCKQLFDQALQIQKNYFAALLTQDQRDQQLELIQNQVDTFVKALYNLP